MYDIIIKNVLALVENGQSCRCTIGISNGVITHLGEYCEQMEAKTVIDGQHKLAIPGLINCHCHIPMTILRSYSDNLPLEKWLFENIIPIEDKFTEQDVYWGAIIGIMELLASGVTVFADMYNFENSIAKAVVESGIKANLSRCALYPGDDFENMEEDIRLKEALQLYYEFDKANNNRVRIDFSLHSVYLAGPQYLEFVMNKLSEIDANLHVHLSETLTENRNCLQTYKKTPAQLMNDSGVFDKPCYAAHCVHLSDNDIEIFKQKNVTAVHNPTSNLKLGSGIAKLGRLFKAGVNVALGTDGAASNNNLNMVEELHIASLLQNGAEQNATALSMTDAFNMATKNGAQALRRQTGVLKQGYCADIAILNIDKPHFVPMHNPLSNLLYSAGGSDVETTIVDGEILYHNGEFKTLDFEKAKFHINKCIQRLM